MFDNRCVHGSAAYFDFNGVSNILWSWQHGLVVDKNYFRICSSTGVISTLTSNRSGLMPCSTILLRTSYWRFSLTNEHAALLSLSLICVLLSSPSKPRYSRLIPMSISSENLSMSPQHLLRDVPPLNERCSEYGRVNKARKTCVTHQSFSMTCWSSPSVLRVCSRTSSLAHSRDYTFCKMAAGRRGTGP